MLNKIKNYYFEIILILFIPVLYWKYIPEWFSEWTDPDSFYAFAVFVIAFLCYLIKINFEKLKNIPKENYYPGTFILLAGLMLYVFGYRADIAQSVNLSLPVFISGIILTFWGRKFFKAVFLYILLLAMVLPIIPLYRFTLPLQLLSAKFSSSLINFLGVHSSVEGSIVSVERYKIAVVAGCSGLKSSSTLFFFAIINSYLINAKLFKKILFILFSIPLSVAMNVLRISVVGFYTLYNGYAGMQQFHDNLGIVIFLLSLGIMITAARFIEDKEIKDRNEA